MLLAKESYQTCIALACAIRGQPNLKDLDENDSLTAYFAHLLPHNA